MQEAVEPGRAEFDDAYSRGIDNLADGRFADAIADLLDRADAHPVEDQSNQAARVAGVTEEELSPGSTGEAGSRHERTWDEYFADLAQFKEKHGHCNVPLHWPEDPELARWVDDQRRAWAQGTLGARCRELASLGFDFVG